MHAASSIESHSITERCQSWTSIVGHGCQNLKFRDPNSRTDAASSAHGCVTFVIKVATAPSILVFGVRGKFPSGLVSMANFARLPPLRIEFRFGSPL